MNNTTRFNQQYFRWVIMLAAFFLFHGSIAQENTSFPLIPYPSHLEVTSGDFHITKDTKLVLPEGDIDFSQEAEQLNLLIHNVLGKSLKITHKSRENSINLMYDASITAEEGYRLNISSTGINISAKAPAAMFRAVQTLRQLMPVSVETVTAESAEIILPALNIEDEPTYGWRGLHLDVSRHFFSTDYLKKLLDLMALYKFNKFHLHLTDDQGWRIEIKKYPKLTEEGAWRVFNNQDSVCMERAEENPDMAIDPQHIIQRDGKTLYGGFFTQEEIKEIIRYAAERHIEIIPEIDMPGHMNAAIESYPELSCVGGGGWGELFTIPICPCNEYTYTFAEDVFSEIIDLFPSKYIHLGADEVEKSTWEESAVCKEVMEREGLSSVDELQSYFVHRMQKFFASKGKELIGWDDMLEGGIDSTATVMYWRSWVKDAPLEAAENGNDIVMTPVSTLYFDYVPDKNSLNKVYHFSPVPDEFNEKQAQAILGGQANLWTEYIPTENRADYMYFPRATALAEAVWHGEDHYESYLQRLNQHYARLNALDVHYRLPDLEGFTQSNVFVDEATFSIDQAAEGLTIHYSLDGSVPDQNSKVLERPLNITEAVTIKLLAFSATGLKGDLYTIDYKQQDLAKPVSIQNTEDGLSVYYYKERFTATTKMLEATAVDSFQVQSIKVPEAVDAESFGLQYRAYLNVPESGIYSFYFTCDDGGVLRIADRLVVDNDGNHPAMEKSGQVALQKGAYPFHIDFIEAGGGYTLKLMYSKDGSEPQAIPDDWFSH